MENKPAGQAPVQALQTKTLAPVDELANNIDKMKMEFAALLPPGVTPEKFIRVLKTAIRNNVKIVGCSRQSLYSESMKCAQDGLLPDGREAALVPFGDDVKYMPMPAGICKRARNSGEIAVIDALTVFEKDKYEAWIDEKGQHFKHVKALGERGKPILTYAYALTKDGGLYFEEMDAKTIEAIKKMALAKSRGTQTPWDGPFEDEMRRKSALHRLCKYRIPSSSDMEEILSRDTDLYEDVKKEEPATGGEPFARGPKRARDIIEGQVVKDPEPPANEPPAPTQQVPI